jgi:hypothetical protein
MNSRSLLWVGLVLVVAATPPATAQNLGMVPSASNLVKNGGFETGDFSNWTMSGNTSYSFVLDSGWNPPHSGTYAGYFGPELTSATLSQTLNTVAGHSYTVDFWLTNIIAPAGAPPNGNAFTAAFGGSQPQVSLQNVGLFDWTEYSFTTVATSSSTALTFSFLNNPGYFGLDDVQVTDPMSPTPPPPTLLATLAGGLIGGLRILRARRRGRVA